MEDLTNDISNELHHRVVRNFERRKVIVYHVDDIWGADLVDMQEWKSDNNNNSYILTVIDVMSKYGWAEPIKNKQASTVLNAFEKIIKESKRKPYKLWVDQGTEFYNKNFEKYLTDNDISMYSTYGEHKSVVVERFNRTIKDIMWKYFTAKNTRKYIDDLPSILDIYNNNVHSKIKMTPIEASKPENFKSLIKIFSTDKKQKIKKPNLRIGDFVRISRIKGKFEKGYLPNYSREIFKISEVINSNPITYKIIEYDNTPIEGSFYEQELLKTKQKDIFEVEKILKKKKVKGKETYFVKYLGWPDKYNSWIDAKDLLDIDLLK